MPLGTPRFDPSPLEAGRSRRPARGARWPFPEVGLRREFATQRFRRVPRLVAKVPSSDLPQHAMSMTTMRHTAAKRTCRESSNDAALIRRCIAAETSMRDATRCALVGTISKQSCCIVAECVMRSAPHFFRLVRLIDHRYSGVVMGDESSLLTGQSVADHGIYQSACSCRTALTLLVDQVLPRCMGCDESVEWRLVQEIHSSRPAPPRTHPSGTRFVAVAVPRPRFDSASGED